MKKSLAPPIFFLLLFLSNHAICQQWNQVGSTSDVYLSPTSAKAGIGTDVPAASLHLKSNALGANTTFNGGGLLLENSTPVTGNFNQDIQSSPAIVLSGSMWNYISTISQPVRFKIDATANPATYNVNNITKTFASFRVQRFVGSSYTDFFSVDNPSYGGGHNLSLNGVRVIGTSSSGVGLFTSQSTSGGNIAFYNNDGSINYGFISNAVSQPISGGGTKNVAGTMVLGTSGDINNVNPYALLDMVGSSNPSVNAKGFMMPRVTTARMNGITGTSPVALAEGLQVYNNEQHAPYYYNGSQWVPIGASSNANPNVMYVSPLQFGAKFDGVTDDIDALYATYNYCNSLPYNKLVIIQMPPGICRITRPWVIGPSTLDANSHYQPLAKWVSETDCYRSILPTGPGTNYGHGNPPSYDPASSALDVSKGAKPVSIEGSGATAIYLDFDNTELTAGIYYAPRGNTTDNLELYSYHISGIGIYGKGYFDLLPLGSSNPTSIQVHLENNKKHTYQQITNNQVGIVCPNINKFTIENCTFRDLQQAILISSGFVSVKNCVINSCVKGYYCWSAAGSTIENVNVFSSELAFEIRSGDMIVSNIYTSFCPTSLWVGIGTGTFNACYFESNNTVDGAAQVIIGNNSGEAAYEWYPDNPNGGEAPARIASGINFNSLTIVARKSANNPDNPNETVAGTALWMKQTARKVSINGGYIWDNKLLEGAENELSIKGVDGLFTDAYSPGSPGIANKVSMQDINGSFKTMKLTNYAITPTPTTNCYRPLCVDKYGQIVPCPPSPTTPEVCLTP